MTVIYGYKEWFIFCSTSSTDWLFLVNDADDNEISHRMRGQNTGCESQGSKISMGILTNFWGLFLEHNQGMWFQKTSILATAQNYWIENPYKVISLIILRTGSAAHALMASLIKQLHHSLVFPRTDSWFPHWKCPQLVRLVCVSITVLPGLSSTISLCLSPEQVEMEPL